MIFSFFFIIRGRPKEFNAVLEKFQGHCVKWRNVIYERMKFNQRIQQECESVENFITNLYICIIKNV